MSRQWVPYNQGSAVQEAIAMANALTEQGVEIKPMHQGYEETEPEGLLEQHRKFQDHASGRYSPATGHASVTEAFARFAADFMGLPNDHVFTLQANGRVGLGHAMQNVVSQYPVSRIGELAALVPASRWPMVDAKTKQAHIQTLIEYGVERDQIAANIINALEKDADDGNKIAVVYTNFPHNPTGLSSSAEEISAIQSKLDELNQKRVSNDLPPIVHVADDPYFMGLPQNDDKPVFQSPYAGQFRVDGPTPSFHIISFSKALATASPGFHGTVITNSKMAAQYKSFLTTDLGPSFVPDFMSKQAAMLQPEFHDSLRDHFAKIRKKYETNNPIFEQNVESCVDGDPGMTRVFRVPQDTLGKSVTVLGQTRTINTTRDVAAYIANTTGTILVAQAESGRESLIRAALKSENPDMIEEGSKDIAKALNELANAPAAAAA